MMVHGVSVMRSEGGQWMSMKRFIFCFDNLPRGPPLHCSRVVGIHHFIISLNQNLGAFS